MEDCVFCTIVREETDTELIHQDEQAVVFADRQPSAPLHLLVVPRRHVSDITELPEEDDLATDLFKTARRLGTQHDTTGHGFRIALNSGNQAEINHLHLHVLGGHPSLGPIADVRRGGDST